MNWNINNTILSLCRLFERIIPKEDLEKAKEIVNKNSVDIIPILHSLKTHILTIASNET